jgi:cell division protein FtsB
LLRLLFFISHRCAFLRGGANDVVERRTTTTSKEDENDEVDAQENGKDTSLKLRDDDEFIETRQNDDE